MKEISHVTVNNTRFHIRRKLQEILGQPFLFLVQIVDGLADNILTRQDK